MIHPSAAQRGACIDQTEKQASKENPADHFPKGINCSCMKQTQMSPGVLM